MYIGRLSVSWISRDLSPGGWAPAILRSITKDSLEILYLRGFPRSLVLVLQTSIYPSFETTHPGLFSRPTSLSAFDTAIPIVVCTDSYLLYECLVKLGTTKEKRLMIDIIALRQSYKRRELFEIR